MSDSDNAAQALGARSAVTQAEKDYVDKYGHDLFVYATNIATLLGKPLDFELLLAEEANDEAKINLVIMKGEGSATATQAAPPEATKVDNTGTMDILSRMERQKYSNIRSELYRSRQGYQSLLDREADALATYQNAVSQRISNYAKIKELEHLFLTEAAIQNPTYLEWVMGQMVDDWWTLVGVYKQDGAMKLLFATGRVVLQDRNPSAGIDMTVDMGQYLVELDANTLSPRLFPYIGNIAGDTNYYHPHASRSGFCLGEGQSTFQRAQSDKDLKTALAVLKGILLTYNGRSPYRSLASFEQRVREGKARANWTTTLEEQCRPAYRALINKGVDGDFSGDFKEEKSKKVLQ